MSTKTTYKQTELGLIPDDWEVKKIDDVLDIFPTASYSRAEQCEDGDVQYLHYGDIHTKYNFHLKINNNNLPKISVDKLKNYKTLEIGDLIMADASEDYVGVGKCVEILELSEKKAIAGLHTFLLRDKKQNFSLGFKGYMTTSNIVKKQFYRTAVGTKVYSLSKTSLQNLKIPLPPLLEQKKIADCLSTWDSAIEKQSQLINALTQRKKALMQQLLTGKKRLPGFSDEWKEVKLGSICENFQNGNAFSAKDYKKTGIPIVTMGNINLGGYFYFSESKSNFWIEDKSLERYEIKKGDLIIAMTDVTPEKNLIGLTSIIDIDRIFYLNQRVGHIILKPKLADTDFIFYLSQNSYWRNQCKAFATLGVQANLGTNDIKNINIKLPSLSEQTAIAEILATADRELQLQKEKLAQLQIQKKGLMQVLLTGKKRLIN